MTQAQIELQNALTTTFLANLAFLSEYDKELYYRIDELSRMIENGTYQEKYALEFIMEKGEFDIYDIVNDKYLYKKNPKRINDEMVKRVEFNEKNAIFDLPEYFLFEKPEKIDELKKSYVEYLTPIVTRKLEEGKEPTSEELLKCQQLGAEYFNFVENFVGKSGLLGAHANGKWITGFAENCHSILNAFIMHINFLKSYNLANMNFQELDINTYANMQRMTKEYLQKEQWETLENNFKKKIGRASCRERVSSPV